MKTDTFLFIQMKNEVQKMHGSRAINASHSTKEKKRENKNENEKKYVLKHKNAQFKLKPIN